jgi:hypothetical protein
VKWTGSASLPAPTIQWQRFEPAGEKPDPFREERDATLMTGNGQQVKQRTVQGAMWMQE